MSEPRILLADADAFYVSVARLVDPKGAGRARLLIVGGSAEGRGVVTSASYEARQYGVHSAMPMVRALRLCPGATVVPVPWSACGELSHTIREALERFTPVVERASIDEFYLDMGGTELLYHHEPLDVTARRMRDAVREETKLDVTIGGGTSRLVAKLAVGVAKPSGDGPGEGVHIVPPGAEAEFLRRFALAEIPFIGPSFQERLRACGLVTVRDVLAHERRALIGWFGDHAGNWLYDRVRGVDSALVVRRRDAKSISRDETFAQDIDDDRGLTRELLRMADRASRDLRDQHFTARTITVKLRDADFTTRQASRTLPEPVSSDRAVYGVARDLLRKLRAARRMPARLIGVSLSQLVPVGGRDQLDLFPEPPPGASESERDRAVARAMDAVRERFGPDALGRGAARGRSRD